MKNIVARLTVVGAILSLGIAAHAQAPSFGWGDDPVKPKTVTWGSGKVTPKTVTWGNGLTGGIATPKTVTWGSGKVAPKTVTWGSIVSGSPLMSALTVTWGG